MDEGKHFCFETVRFERGIAHDGEREIFFKRVADRDGGSACNFLDFVIVPVGADIGTHTHATDNEETYIVVSGRGVMQLDGREIEVGPGHVIVNRPGGTHGLRNTGPHEMRLIVVEVAVGSEGGRKDSMAIAK